MAKTGNKILQTCYNISMSFIRQFKTKSGATGVQVCTKCHGTIIRTVHVGSAKSNGELRLLIKQAEEIIKKEKTPLFNLDDYLTEVPLADNLDEAVESENRKKRKKQKKKNS